MKYELSNLIVNIVPAIVGAVVGAVLTVLLVRPKKEKATGYFEIEFLNEITGYLMFTEPVIKTFSKTRLNFSLNNNGKVDIFLNRDLGAFLKIKNKSINLNLSALMDKDTFVPKKMNKSFSIFVLDNDRIAELYSNKDCVLSIYTITGTEIKLRKR